MKKVLLVNILVIIMLSTHAQIYQFRGPNRDGKFPESGLLKEWPENGPQLLLEYEGIGEGYSSVISNGKYIYASGKIEDMDHLTCIDFEGNELGQVAYGRSWNQSTPNTRGTPTIEDDRIYIISGMGEMVCLDAETGNIIWKINVDEDYKADWHRWGVAESPLIVGNKVICSAAGALTTFVAFDKMTGEEIWRERRALGKGCVTYAEGMLYCVDEQTHEVALVEATREAYIEHGRFTLPKQSEKSWKGRFWAHPVVINGKLFLRDEEYIFCYDVSAK